MTDMIDIYEAAGGTVNEDRSAVTISGPSKPFKIELLVIPTEIHSTGLGGPNEIVFQILLNDERSYHETVMGTRVDVHEYTDTVRLPVSQVKIIKED